MGILRLYLAVCVFLWHCWMVEQHHALGSFAAVYCFFIISGFYISMVLTETYPASRIGTIRFYANRALRLFPIYLTVLFATALAYAAGLVPYGVAGLNTLNPLAALNQITVLPEVIWRNVTLDTMGSKNTLAIGWYYTVGLEMIFYVLAPFFVRWRLPNLILLFVVSGVVHFIPYMLGLPDRQWQYEFFPSTAVLFIAGSLSYRLYLAIKNDANRYVGWLLVPGVVAFGAFFDVQVYTDSFQPIVIYGAFTLMMPLLFIAARGSKIDKFLGDISYPFYVVHGLAAALVGGGVGRPTSIVAGLSLTFALAIALRLLVDHPIERMRTAIRSGAKIPLFRFIRISASRSATATDSGAAGRLDNQSSSLASETA
jgi:peptidoglycan/LPS O-acetylase OafA/YrhL